MSTNSNRRLQRGTDEVFRDFISLPQSNPRVHTTTLRPIVHEEQTKFINKSAKLITLTRPIPIAIRQHFLN